MSNELTYRSLAAVSIAKVQEPEVVVQEVSAEGGRFYATIHRSSSRMPESLRADYVLQGPAIKPTPIDTFMIPKMSS
jgi:hypothetical protein